MKLTTSLNITAAVLGSVLTLQSANAAIALDRTRVIFNDNVPAMSVNISNQNKELPYLAQAWIEDEKGNKLSTGPLMALPPVQRVEPGAKSMIKIQSTPATSALPQDRESVFYFNVREIPPRSKKPNVLQLALQTRVKLFYRPKGIIPSKNDMDNPWQDKLTLQRNGEGYMAVNPTPYYITLIDAEPSRGSTANKKFQAIMVPPLGSVSLNTSAALLGSAPVLTYINDYGGRPVLSMNCTGADCHVVSDKA